MDNSAIMCDEVIESNINEETNFNEKKATLKWKILLGFLLITLALLIAVSI